MATGRTQVFPRRRPRETSHAERVVGATLLVVIAFLVALFFRAGRRPGPVGLPEPRAAAALLPLKTPGGWGRGAVETYTTESLFEKIDGKADAYVAYEVRGLEFASYAKPDDPSVFVDVYLYDMTEPINAYGVYRSQRSGAEEVLAAGEEGCIADGAAFLRKGRYYVELTGSGPEAVAEVRAAAGAVAAALPAAEPAASDPAWVPRDGLKSVRYVRENCLGVEALRRAFLADYEGGAKLVVAPGGESERKEAEETLEFLGTPARFVVANRRVVGVVGKVDEALLAAVLRALEEAD